MLERHNLIMAGYINLPPFSEENITKLLEWHDLGKDRLDNLGAEALGQPWIASKIRDFEVNLKSPILVKNSIPGNPWNLDFAIRFPDLVSIFNSLPFKKIERILLLQNTKFCPSHNDQSKFLYDDNYIEPCNYRLTLRNSKKSKGFFVQPKQFKDWGTQHALKNHGLPAVHWNPKPGYWWVLNNFCCQHGSDWKEGDDKVILSVQGTPDHEKHLELIKNSEHLKCVNHPNLTRFDNASPEEKQKKLENLKNIVLTQEVPEELKGLSR
jgi:hypothetical protein